MKNQNTFSSSCCSGSNNVANDQINIANLSARVSQSDIAGVYNNISSIYDIWGKLTESKARNRAIDLANITDGQKILEVAVGTGLAFYELVKRNPNGETHGLDLSPGMLKKAQEKVTKFAGKHKFSLQVGSAYELPFADHTFDTLVNNYMFDLIEEKDMAKILTEFKRVLKPNGTLILVNMTEGESAPSQIYDAIYNISPKTMGGCRGVKLSSLLEKEGFKVHLREYYQQMLFPSEVIKATI